MTTPKHSKAHSPLVQGAALILLVVIGFGGRGVLGAMRSAPSEVEPAEPVLDVEIIRVYPEDVPVFIEGYGEVKPTTVLPIGAKVAGEVTEVHPQLQVGNVIRSGEVIFRVDAQDYETKVAEAEASLTRASSALEQLRIQSKSDTERLEAASTSLKLAREDFDSIQKLYEAGGSSKSQLNESEIAYNTANDAYLQLEQLVGLQPHRMAEAEAVKSAAEAQLAQAETWVKRSVTRAPFDARVVDVQIELGQYAVPGLHVATIAGNDFELIVPLDSRDARLWLPYKEETARDSGQWFGELEPVPCDIAWTEDPKHHTWKGTLARIERLNPATRTVDVAVHVTPAEAQTGDTGFPLVEGMFCTVSIHGRTMQQVFRVPRWAVSFDGQVHVAVEQPETKLFRLSMRNVEIARLDGEDALISTGLAPGDRVVVTRLVNPAMHARVRFEEPNASTPVPDRSPPSSGANASL